MVIVRPITRTIISTVSFGFPVVDWINNMTPTPWVAPTYLNGWTGNAKYRRIGDILYLGGNLAGGAIGQQMFLLPTGFIPQTGFEIAVVTRNAAGNVPGHVAINLAGAVTLWSGATAPITGVMFTGVNVPLAF